MAQSKDTPCQVRGLRAPENTRVFVQLSGLVVAVYGTNPYRLVVTDFTSNSRLERFCRPDLEAQGFAEHSLVEVAVPDDKLQEVVSGYWDVHKEKLLSRYGRDQLMADKMCIVTVNGEVRSAGGTLELRATRVRLAGDDEATRPYLKSVYASVMAMDSAFVAEHFERIQRVVPMLYWMRSQPGVQAAQRRSEEAQEAQDRELSQVKSEPLGDDELVPDTLFQDDYVEDSQVAASAEGVGGAENSVGVTSDAGEGAGSVAQLAAMPLALSPLVHTVSARVVAVIPDDVSFWCTKTPGGSDPQVQPIELVVADSGEGLVTAQNSLRLHLDEAQIRTLLVDEPTELLYTRPALWTAALDRILNRPAVLKVHTKAHATGSGDVVVWTCRHIAA